MMRHNDGITTERASTNSMDAPVSASKYSMLNAITPVNTYKPAHGSKFLIRADGAFRLFWFGIIHPSRVVVFVVGTQIRRLCCNILFAPLSGCG